jgi:hypothetical protein
MLAPTYHKSADSQDIIFRVATDIRSMVTEKVGAKCILTG